MFVRPLEMTIGNFSHVGNIILVFSKQWASHVKDLLINQQIGCSDVKETFQLLYSSKKKKCRFLLRMTRTNKP